MARKPAIQFDSGRPQRDTIPVSNWVLNALVAVVVAIVGVVAFLVLCPQAREPVYQGKPLSFWLDEYVDHFPLKKKRSAERREMAAHAIRQIGTNAIPTLLKMLRKEDPDVLKRFAFSWECYFRNKRHVPAWIQYPAWWRHQALYLEEEAGGAFRLLGTNAQQAVPELIRIYEHRIPPDPRGLFGVLHPIGPDALRMGVPIFLRWAASSKPYERREAVQMLAQAGVAAEQVMPVFLKGLSDTDFHYRVQGAYGLGRLGTNAQQAVPALALLLNDPEYVVRWEVTNTLKAIGREGAVKAGVQ